MSNLVRMTVVFCGRRLAHGLCPRRSLVDTGQLDGPAIDAVGVATDPVPDRIHPTVDGSVNGRSGHRRRRDVPRQCRSDWGHGGSGSDWEPSWSGSGYPARAYKWSRTRAATYLF